MVVGIESALAIISFATMWAINDVSTNRRTMIFNFSDKQSKRSRRQLHRYFLQLRAILSCAAASS